MVSIASEHITYIWSITEANTESLGIIGKLKGERKIYFGLDCEWNYFDGTNKFKRVLQLSFPGTNVLVLNLSAMNVHTPDDVPDQLRNLLQISNIIP